MITDLSELNINDYETAMKKFHEITAKDLTSKTNFNCSSNYHLKKKA